MMIEPEIVERGMIGIGPNRVRPWGVAAALAIGLLAFACRSSEGERCVCADDCRDGLLCVAEGRVLEGDECSPIVGPGANPGLCVDAAEAGLNDEGGGLPEVFMDLGSKRDFDPGAPPDPDPATDTGTGSSDGASTGSTGTTTDSTNSTGTTDPTSSSSGGSESSSSTSGSSGSSGSGTTAGT